MVVPVVKKKQFDKIPLIFQGKRVKEIGQRDAGFIMNHDQVFVLKIRWLHYSE